MLLLVIFNQRSDPLLLDGFQCCCDIQNSPISIFVKLISMACGDLSRENYQYSIQGSVVIIAHGGETWPEQGGDARYS